MYRVPTASHEYKPGSELKVVPGTASVFYFPFSAQAVKPGRLAASLAGPAVVVGSPAWYRSLGGGYGYDADNPGPVLPTWGNAGRMLTLPRAFVGDCSPGLSAWLADRGVLVYPPVLDGTPERYVPAAGATSEERLVRAGVPEVRLLKPQAVPVKWMGGDLYLNAPSQLREGGAGADGPVVQTYSGVVTKDTCGALGPYPTDIRTIPPPPPVSKTQGYRKRTYPAETAGPGGPPGGEANCFLYTDGTIDPATGLFRVCEGCSYATLKVESPEHYDYFPEKVSKPTYDLLHALYAPACRKFRVAGHPEYDNEGADYRGGDLDADVMAFFGG